MSYGQSSDPFSQLRGSITRAGIPVVISLIAINAVLFLADFFSHHLVSLLLGCTLDHNQVVPKWSPLTYFLVTPDFVSLVFACLWLYWMGGSLERSWGAKTFAGFTVGISLLTAVSVWLGTTLLHTGYVLIGLWIPLASLTVAWAAINPNQVVQIYMVLPVKALWLAAFTVGMVYFVYFGGDPMLGLFGLVAPAAALLYVRGGFSSGYRNRGYASRGPDLKMVGARPRSFSLDGSSRPSGPLGWWQDMQERRKLKKLLRDSGFKDPDLRP